MNDCDLNAILGESAGVDSSQNLGVDALPDRLQSESGHWDSVWDLDSQLPRPAYAPISGETPPAPASAEPSAVYTGTRLPNPLGDDEFIRILEILPAPPPSADAADVRSQPLICRLHVTSLAAAEDTYEALSYTWRTESEWYSDVDDSAPDKLFALWLNGVQSPCRPNLFAALMTLRCRDGRTSRFIWADALCVNQEDLAERSNQVRLMGDIFGRARRVVIWLGLEPLPKQRWARFAGSRDVPHVPGSTVRGALEGVCGIVNSWAERAGLQGRIPVATYHQGYHYWSPTSVSATVVDQPHSPPPLTASSPIWKKVFELYSQRWFRRVWVIQEAALARRAVVVWDSYSIPWEWVGLAAAIVRTNYSRLTASTKIPEDGLVQCQDPERKVPTGVVNAYLLYRIGRSSRFYEPLQFSFHRLLALSRQFDCQDDRDRIYGLLGLPMTDSEDIARKIVPNYERRVEEVYTQLAELFIDNAAASTQIGSLAVLSSVQRAHNLNGTLRRHYHPRTKRFYWNLPSWVPQWQFVLSQSLAPPESSPGFNASLGRGAMLRRANAVDRHDSSGRPSLVVRGVLVDTVAAVEFSEFKSFWRGEQPDSSSSCLFGHLDGSNMQESPAIQPEDRKNDDDDDDTETIPGLDAARAHLEHLAMTLTAGRNWYGLPVRDVDAHVADYAKCLVKNGLAWTLRDGAFGSHYNIAEFSEHGPTIPSGPMMFRYEPNSDSSEDEAWESWQKIWRQELQSFSAWRTPNPKPQPLPVGLKVMSSKSQQADDNQARRPADRVLRRLARGGNADRFLDAAATALRRRGRFTTLSGLQGIGPEAMYPGDTLCVLFGSSVPFILRRLTEGYQLVGECYVRDIMEGEVVRLLERTSGLEVQEIWIKLF